jgi:sterol desaturase/sphingolipid hydroxylase (fatty acid hydroxylase superfamily)
MHLTSRPHPDRIRLFQSNWMERTTLTPFPVFLTVWLLLIAALGWFASRHLPLPTVALFALAGLVLWPMVEYAAHRYVFHFEPTSDRGRRMVFMIHMNHHIDPGDPLRGLMPLTVSLPLALLFWAMFRLCLGPSGDAMLLGFVAGYVTYDTVHWACHQLPMRGRLAARLKRHHLRHHHAGQKANYAITAIFLDPLFRSGLKRR